VEALMGYYTRKDRGSVDAIAARLQSGAPLFFGGDERMFYRARELLQARRVRRFFFFFFFRNALLFRSVRSIEARGVHRAREQRVDDPIHTICQSPDARG
jgi:hypothetical protein